MIDIFLFQEQRSIYLKDLPGNNATKYFHQLPLLEVLRLFLFWGAILGYLLLPQSKPEWDFYDYLFMRVIN